MPSGTDLFDQFGHEILVPGQTQLTAGAVSTNAAGTIAPTASAGATPTTAIVDCTDRRGQFTLSPVTGGGAQAAGIVVKVAFANPYPKAPGSIIVQLEDTTASPVVAVSAVADSITNLGFNVVVAAALTTAHVYNGQYTVVI